MPNSIQINNYLELPFQKYFFETMVLSLFLIGFRRNMEINDHSSFDRKLNNILKEREIYNEESLKNLDSLDKIEFGMELEEEFGININDEDLVYIKDLESLKKMIKRKINEVKEARRKNYF